MTNKTTKQTLKMQKPTNQQLYEWQKTLPQLKQKFNQMKLKHALKTNRTMIEKLNEIHVKADHVLVRQFLQKYSKTEQLEKQSTFQQIQSFFSLLKQKYQQVETKYLKVTLQPQQDKKIETISQEIQGIDRQKTEQVQAEKQKPFTQSKMNLQKFIKDQHEFYQTILHKNLQTSQEEQQKFMKAQPISQFLKALFNDSPHIKAFASKQNITADQNFRNNTTKILKRYAVEIKQLTQQDFSIENFSIAQGQILQFLTFWLQESINLASIRILYARTSKTMQRLQKQYLNNIQANNTKILLKDKQQDGQKNIESDDQSTSVQKVQSEMNKKSKKLLKSERTNKKITIQDQPTQSILNKYREHPSILKGAQRTDTLKSVTDKEKIQKIIPDLFMFCCKIRSRNLRGTTFDQIQQEKQFMNLQKFINFCKYAQVNTLLSRESLIQEFKNHAINRLTLNLSKFLILIKRLVQIKPQITRILLNVQKMSVMKKKNVSEKLITQNGKGLSTYNYQIRPVNGKDIESIEIQLKEKKILKQIVKKHKQEISILKRKQGYLEKYQQSILKKQSHDKSRTVINSSASFRDPQQKPKNQLKRNQRNISQKFNPQSLISNYGEEDKLWDQYESKIWKKDKNRPRISQNQTEDHQLNESILQQALSRRLEKGKNVLKKITSSNLKYYL